MTETTETTSKQFFERWWNAKYISGKMTTKEAAWAAWQASREARIIEGLDTMVSIGIHEDPQVDRQVDWHKKSAETKEAARLATRHGLCIMSVAGTEDRRVQATRPGKKMVFIETDGWPRMIEVLKDMARKGTL